MELVILGFCIILLVLYGSKAVVMHRSYQKEVYSALFGSYLEYFWKHVIRHDCSQSSLMKQTLGTHRISYAMMQNEKRVPTSLFVIIFYNKGITCISYFHSGGALKGKETDKHWMISRGGKTYRMINPIIECKKYQDYLRQQHPDVAIQTWIACDNATNISKVHVPIVLYRDLLTTLKQVDAPFISEEMIYQEFAKTKNQKGN